MITSIYISIYDTTLPGGFQENILDFAKRSSIHWIFDGGDDKFLSMMPSRLEFEMEVPIQESLDVLVYDYLFTGNETRYNVQICDQDDRIIWQGFLIPEEYMEPYETGTFFIRFTATDGLGRLKGKTLPSSFYRARQSVMKTIADCLKETGLSLEIWMDPAIINADAGERWEDIYVDAQRWSDGDSPLNAYDILDAILQEIQCTLFQQDNRWYVIGWNKRGVISQGYRKYTFEGVYIPEATLVDLSSKYLGWYASPSVSIKPPFREVSVKENLADTIDLFPHRLITQPWVMESEGQTPPPPKFWKHVGMGELRLYETADWDFKPYEDEPFEQEASVGIASIEANIPTVAPWPEPVDNYITLFSPIYMKGHQYIDIDFSWNYKERNTTNANIDPWLDLANYYEITLNGNVIISNRENFPGRNNFLWKAKSSWVDGFTYLTPVVKIRRFYLPENGFVNIKFFATATSISPVRVDKQINDLTFTYRKDVTNFFKKRRVIDFTTTKEIAINNGGSVFDEMEHSFIYQPPIQMEDLQPIPFTVIDAEKARFSMSPFHFILFSSKLDSIYVQRSNSDFFEHIAQCYDIFSIMNFAGQLIFPDGHRLHPEDKIYVRHGFTGTPQTKVVVEARERWLKTTHSDKADRLGNVIAELCHDIYPSSIITMEGSVKGLVQPKDILQFELKQQLRNLIPLRIDIMPNENTSSITAVEYKNEKVTNYGG